MRLSQLVEFKKYSHSGEGYADTRRIPRRDPDRGPHESKELAMMLDGVKPAALVHSGTYEQFKPYIESGRFISKSYIDRLGGVDWVVALAGEERRIDAIIKLLGTPWEELQKRMSDDMYHARLGRLLGYTKEQVRKFIQNDFQA